MHPHFGLQKDTAVKTIPIPSQFHSPPVPGASWTSPQLERLQPPTSPAVPFTATRENELERLKYRLLADAIRTYPNPAFHPRLRRAANEAASIAWLEPHPLLVFPVLFEEKAQAASKNLNRSLPA